MRDGYVCWPLMPTRKDVLHMDPVLKDAEIHLLHTIVFLLPMISLPMYFCPVMSWMNHWKLIYWNMLSCTWYLTRKMVWLFWGLVSSTEFKSGARSSFKSCICHWPTMWSWIIILAQVLKNKWQTSGWNGSFHTAVGSLHNGLLLCTKELPSTRTVPFDILAFYVHGWICAWLFYVGFESTYLQFKVL